MILQTTKPEADTVKANLYNASASTPYPAKHTVTQSQLLTPQHLSRLLPPHRAISGQNITKDADHPKTSLHRAEFLAKRIHHRSHAAGSNNTPLTGRAMTLLATHCFKSTRQPAAPSFSSLAPHQNPTLTTAYIRRRPLGSVAEQTKSLEVAGSLLPIRVDAEEMIGVRLVRSAVLVSLLLVFPASVLASWDGNEIPPSLPSSSESSPATSLAGAQTANKRSISFDSCTGVYDRELLVRLDRVCEDCYNLYRDTDVAVECRSNCFHNEVFLYCVDYMYRPRQRNQYRPPCRGSASRRFLSGHTFYGDARAMISRRPSQRRTVLGRRGGGDRAISPSVLPGNVLKI
ncbi:crustacean hyperglycemic hormone 2 precursor [Penaeus vannamei]|uniref:Crustacean hyperglycemic hormone 2 n=1 Tax=Penaeus vannamei TaxID=6689 RepID=A0A3R7NK18_PENVA|nr:crustacean hyperglycemic hormone 2 precursor [Penaeus vannamei]